MQILPMEVHVVRGSCDRKGPEWVLRLVAEWIREKAEDYPEESLERNVGLWESEVVLSVAKSVESLTKRGIWIGGMIWGEGEGDR